MATDVFISYSTKNTAIAEAVCAYLEGGGLTCWIAPRDILPAQSWIEAIIDGINSTRVLVLVLSNASNASPQVLREVERAVHKRVPLLVFRVEEVTLSKSLEYLVSVEQWLDALTEPIHPHLPRLAESVKRLIQLGPEPDLDLIPTRPVKIAPVAPTPPHNLPRQVSSFIGREKEREEVKQLLTTTPMLTLTGPGGTGKTRLALQVAAETMSNYADGAWLVELAALTDPALVPQTIATALGLREEPGRPVTETLIDYLAGKQLLLLLDNCEHLISACAQLSDALLQECHDLAILATSREALNVSGERVWPVPTLTQPNLNRLPKSQKDLAAALMGYDAIRMFVERTSVQRPGFAITPQNATVVAQICRRLDGIPLAIELAAARIKAMPVEQVAARLDDCFRLLTGGNRTALPRQQTLRALIDWSYNLLNDQERLLLSRLSVFAGGWTLEAAESVCASEDKEDQIQPFDVLDLLTSLVDKSLAIYEEQGEQARYRLLETVRQYARDRLTESGGREALQTRHRDYFLKFVEDAKPQMQGPEQENWLERLEEEHDNLRAALDYCKEDPQGGDAGLSMAGALFQFWMIRGYWSEGRERYTDALAHPGAQEPSKARADVLNATGALAWRLSDYKAALALYEQSLALRRELGDKRGIASSLINLGHMAFSQGDRETARERYAEALTLNRELGNRALEATTLTLLGNAAFQQGDYAGAQQNYEQSLALNRKLGDKQGIASALISLGNVAYQHNDLQTARNNYEQSLALQRKLGDKLGMAHSLNGLGLASSEQGRYAEACAFFEECLMLCRELGEKHLTAYALEGVAVLAKLQARNHRAVQVYGAADALRESIGAPLPPNDREETDHYLDELRTALGEETFSVTYAAGRTLDWEHAISCALEGDNP